MSLPDWQKNSWLVEHETSPEEIAALLAIVGRDLANAGLAGLAEDWKLNIAYNAARGSRLGCVIACNVLIEQVMKTARDPL